MLVSYVDQIHGQTTVLQINEYNDDSQNTEGKSDVIFVSISSHTLLASVKFAA